MQTTQGGQELMSQADVAGMELFDFIPEDEVYTGPTGKSYAPPPEGKYWGTLPIITDEAFGKTQANFLKVTIDPITIVNPNGPGDGYTVRFTHLSAKKYSNRNTSQVIDFLRACGIGFVPKDAEEAKEVIKALSGKSVQFALQWEAWDKDADVTVTGEDKFPLNDDGTRQSWIPSQVDETKKVYANGKVRYFISAVAK
jgi:hypothetical protein